MSMKEKRVSTEEKLQEIEEMVERLAEKEHQATPPEWFLWTNAGDISAKRIPGAGDPPDGVIFNHTFTEQNEDGVTVAKERAEKDREFVVELRNKAKGIIKYLIERAKHLRDDWEYAKETDDTYMVHIAGRIDDMYEHLID